MLRPKVVVEWDETLQAATEEARLALVVEGAGLGLLKSLVVMAEAQMGCLALAVVVEQALDLAAAVVLQRGHGFLRKAEAHRTSPLEVSRHRLRASSAVSVEVEGLDL